MVMYIEDQEEYEQYYLHKKLEESLIKISNNLIKDSYNLNKNNRITNNTFLEEVWLKEKNNIDNVNTIAGIVIMLENNNYYKFTNQLITHILENYRFSFEEEVETSFFSSLFGTNKKKNNYTFYIYTENFIYYTNFKKKNNRYFTIIPR